jgi:hypothetical protein
MPDDSDRLQEIASTYDKGLKADDPRFNNAVRILHDDGSSMFLYNAFCVQYEGDYIVFSEHFDPMSQCLDRSIS